jgi:hypothetical protein
MLPQSQLILLVILIVLALVLLNWEVGNTSTAGDELMDEPSPTEPSRANQDQGTVSTKP